MRLFEGHLEQTFDMRPLVLALPCSPPLSLSLSCDCPVSCLLFQLIEQRWRLRWRWRCCHGWLPAPQMKQKVLKRAAASVARQCQVQLQCQPHQQQQQSSTAAAHLFCHAPLTLWQRPRTHNEAHLAEGDAICVRLFDTN